MSKTILITGASSGIGLDIARTYDQLGWQVIGLARAGHKLEQAKTLLSERALLLATDVSDPVQVQTAAALIATRVPHLAVLVNNAGLGRFAPFTQLALADFDTVMDTNIRGMFIVTQTFLPLLKRPGGQIINISSMAGQNGYALGTAYCASKFAVRGFSEALREDLAKERIKVAVICPGLVDTAFFTDLSFAPKPGAALSPHQITQVVQTIIDQDESAAISEITIPSARFGLTNHHH